MGDEPQITHREGKSLELRQIWGDCERMWGLKDKLDSANGDSLSTRVTVGKLSLAAMPKEGKTSQENSMEFLGKPSQESSGSKKVGSELEPRVPRSRCKQDVVERWRQREQENPLS